MGTPLTSSPSSKTGEPHDHPTAVWSYWFLIGPRSNRLRPARRGVTVSRVGPTAHVRPETAVRPQWTVPVSVEGLRRESADRRHDGPTQPLALISEPYTTWLSLR